MGSPLITMKSSEIQTYLTIASSEPVIHIKLSFLILIEANIIIILAIGDMTQILLTCTLKSIIKLFAEGVERSLMWEAKSAGTENAGIKIN